MALAIAMQLGRVYLPHPDGDNLFWETKVPFCKDVRKDRTLEVKSTAYIIFAYTLFSFFSFSFSCLCLFEIVFLREAFVEMYDLGRSKSIGYCQERQFIPHFLHGRLPKLVSFRKRSSTHEGHFIQPQRDYLVYDHGRKTHTERRSIHLHSAPNETDLEMLSSSCWV